MKRLLVLTAAVVLGVLVGGFTLVGHTTTTNASTVLISMSGIPGEPASGVTGTTTIMDIAGPMIMGTSSITGLSAIPTSAGGPATFGAVVYYTSKHCVPTAAAAILVFDPGQADQNSFHVEGYPGVTGTGAGPLVLGAMDGSSLVVDTTTESLYTGNTSTILSAGVLNLKNFDINKTPHYPKALVQFLACGNVDLTPVYDWYSGHLLANPVDQMPVQPCDINLDGYCNTGDIHLDIDMVQDGVSTDGKPVWCKTIDTTATHVWGDTYNVAVCLTSSPLAPAGFNFNLMYDDSKNTCVVTPCTGDPTCSDANPDGNIGGTIFGNSTTGAALSLGVTAAGWTCAVTSAVVPSCNKNVGAQGPNKGKAFLECMASGATQDQLTLPVGSGISAPIAVLKFQANPAGTGSYTDTLWLDAVSVIKVGADEMVACPPNEGDPSRCNNATDVKVEPTATFTPTLGPTATDTATATATPTVTNTPTVTATPTTPAGVRMIKSPLNGNLFLMKGTCTPANAALGKGCLEIDVSVTGANDVDNPNDNDNDIEGVGAWEHQIRFDHKFISLQTVPDTTWLGSTGRQVLCIASVVTESSILEGCVTKDQCVNATGTVVPYPDSGCVYPLGLPGPNGGGLIERIYVIPTINDLVYRSLFRPTKDNGIVTDIVDDNCEVTDTQAEAIPGSLPGQLAAECGDAHITIRLLEGDFDLNCLVDVSDDQAVAFRYGSQLGLQLYDRWYDLDPANADDDIDIKDLQFVFGRNYSTCVSPIPNDQLTPVAYHDP